MTNLGSVNAIIEVFIYPSSKRVSNVIPWQLEFTCFCLAFYHLGKWISLSSPAIHILIFNLIIFTRAGISGRNLQREDGRTTGLKH